MSEEGKKRRPYAIIFYISLGMILPFVVFFYWNNQILHKSFNPIDYILKPFLLVPVAILSSGLIVNGTSYAITLLKQMPTTVHALMLSTVLSFSSYNLLNVYVWERSFHPGDFILKPFLLIPVISVVLPLLYEWMIYGIRHIRSLRITLRKTDSSFSLKVIQKSLPIYIIDEDYLHTALELEHSSILVDMRIKNTSNLPIHTVKLYKPNQKVTLPSLIENAHRIVRRTALKNKPVTFIVDSQKERNRTISRIWLRLIRNPNSRTANADIHTILELVY